MKRLMNRVWRPAAAAIALALATGCTVGPNYKRPPVVPPDTYRGQSSAAQPGTEASLGDQTWWEVFQDPQLQALIRTALDRNYDLQIAATRVVEAQARLGITRADQYPTVVGGAGVLGQKNSAAIGSVRTVAGMEIQGTATWQLDFWGRYRRATEAARAQLVGAEWGRRAVTTTLVSQVAGAYFALRALDLQLDISQRTLESRQQSLQLTQVREQGGATSLLDVRQAEQLVYSAQAEIVELERRIEEQENLISTLLGSDPAAVPRGLELTAQPHPPDIPAALPSSLLERRPDIEQAEQNLIAANAQIGVARAAFFPQIPLTATGGYESTALGALFASANSMWSATAALTQPIFTAGRLKSQLAVAQAQQHEMLLSYQQTIQQAFRDVSDSLVDYQRFREFRAQQTLLLASAQDAQRLTDIRYQGGAASYLEVLDAQTRLFDAELGLADSQLNELTALVGIYRALGGGWQP